MASEEQQGEEEVNEQGQGEADQQEQDAMEQDVSGQEGEEESGAEAEETVTSELQEEQGEAEKVDEQVERAEQDTSEAEVHQGGVDEQVEPVKPDEPVIPEQVDEVVKAEEEDCPEQDKQDTPAEQVGEGVKEDSGGNKDEGEKEGEQAMEVEEATPMEQGSTDEVRGGVKAEPIKETMEPANDEQPNKYKESETDLKTADPVPAVTVPAVTMPTKPRPLMETKLPPMTSDYYSASSGKEDVSMATENADKNVSNDVSAPPTEAAKEVSCLYYNAGNLVNSAHHTDRESVRRRRSVEGEDTTNRSQHLCQLRGHARTRSKWSKLIHSLSLSYKCYLFIISLVAKTLTASLLRPLTTPILTSDAGTSRRTFSNLMILTLGHFSESLKTFASKSQRLRRRRLLA